MLRRLAAPTGVSLGLAPVLLICFLGLTPQKLQASVCGTFLYAITAGSTDLYEIDEFFGHTLNQVPLTIPGGVVTGAHAIAGNWLDEQLYILVELGAVSESTLGIVDPATGVITIIGPTGQTFVGFTIDVNGVAYAVTGESGPQPETLYTLDLTTGASTLFCALGASDTGEVIEALPYDNILLHVSGSSGVYDPVTDTGTFLESIDLFSPTPCPGTPRTVDPLFSTARCTALAGLASGSVIWKEGEGAGSLYRYDPYSNTFDAYGATTLAITELASLPNCVPLTIYLRGDANSDGAIDIGDPVFVLLKLFGDGVSACEAAEDANSDGVINIADPIRVLGLLFAGGPDLAHPYPNCDADFGEFLTCTTISCP